MFILPVRWMAGTKRNSRSAVEYGSATETDTSIYFLGSSRTQYSTNPHIVAAISGCDKTYNLGLSSGTFLSHGIMAEFVMHRPGYKILVIELSSYLANLQESVFQFAKQTGFDPIQAAHRITATQPILNQLDLEANLLNNRVRGFFDLREDVKMLVGYRVPANDSWIGFQTSPNERPRVNSSVIGWSEIHAKQSHAIDLRPYREIIDYLERVASTNHSKLIFLLPLNYRTRAEKEVVVSLFQSLPDSNRLHYDKEFLDHMANSDFQADLIHLNERGAVVYSNFIGKKLRERIAD